MTPEVGSTSSESNNNNSNDDDDGSPSLPPLDPHKSDEHRNILNMEENINNEEMEQIQKSLFQLFDTPTKSIESAFRVLVNMIQKQTKENEELRFLYQDLSQKTFLKHSQQQELMDKQHSQQQKLWKVFMEMQSKNQRVCEDISEVREEIKVCFSLLFSSLWLMNIDLITSSSFTQLTIICLNSIMFCLCNNCNPIQNRHSHLTFMVFLMRMKKLTLTKMKRVNNQQVNLRQLHRHHLYQNHPLPNHHYLVLHLLQRLRYKINLLNLQYHQCYQTLPPPPHHHHLRQVARNKM